MANQTDSDDFRTHRQSSFKDTHTKCNCSSLVCGARVATSYDEATSYYKIGI